MDMRLVPIDVHVQNAYSRGNIPLKIHAIANVKMHSDVRYIGNAVERFLNRSMQGGPDTSAQQTLEGALREVVGTADAGRGERGPAEVCRKLDRVNADDDLHKLGFQLDTLKIQNVSRRTRATSIPSGARSIAAALRDAENAENQANQEVTRAQALSEQEAQVAEAAAQTAILQKQNELRRVRAELEGEAQAVEREAEAAAKTARAEAEKDLQELRAALEERRLKADVVIPADTNREARAILAVGEAAPTAENGAAAVEVLRLMSQAWAAMGPQAKELYVIQHLEELVGTVVDNLDNVSVDEVTVLDRGDGDGLASYAAAYPQMVARVMQALAQSTGVDIPGILNGTERRA